MVEFEKVLYSSDLKMILIFLVTKVFQKGTMFKWVTDATSCSSQRQAWWPKCAPPPPPGKLAARLKLPFGGSCHIISVAHSLTTEILGDRNRASAVAQLSRYLFFTCHEIKNRLPRGHFLNLILKNGPRWQTKCWAASWSALIASVTQWKGNEIHYFSISVSSLLIFKISPETTIFV